MGLGARAAQRRWRRAGWKGGLLVVILQPVGAASAAFVQGVAVGAKIWRRERDADRYALLYLFAGTYRS